jgi:hypothetical protein
MAASFDKETLIKHHFWILTGVCLVLLLVPLLMLVTSVSATIEEETTAYEKAKKLVETIKNGQPMNPEFVKAYEKQDVGIESKKSTVWSSAWELQKDMMTWPVELERRGFKRNYQHFGDVIAPDDVLRFNREYYKQIPEIFYLVQPLRTPKEGVVQFRGGIGSFNAVLKIPFISPEEANQWRVPCSQEDIWLAQEDLWVKRELLRIIRATNDAVAIFQEVKPEVSTPKDKKESGQEVPGVEKEKAKPVPPPASDPNHKLFRNHYWELDLTLVREKGKHILRGTLKNIGKHRQPLDSDFKVFLQEGKDSSYHQFHLADEPLPVGKTIPVKDSQLSDQLAIDGIFGVEQVLTWRTAPVKRLDQLELYYASSRTATRSLKRPLWAPEKAPEATGANVPGMDPAGGGGLSVEGSSARGGGDRGDRFGGGAVGGRDGARSKNGLALNRYVDVTESVRHMPVGLDVIMEEEHIPDLLAAVANSSLRIQTTQYHWTHTRERIAPTVNGELAPTPPSTKPGSTPFITPRGRPGTGGPLRPPFGGGGDMELGGSSARGGRRGSDYMPPPPPGERRGGEEGPGGPLPTPSQTAEGEEEMNLVEVAVYGIASLYERYPPKPKETPPADANTTAPNLSAGAEAGKPNGGK